MHGRTADATTRLARCDPAQERPHHRGRPGCRRAPDLVDREFRVPAPNRLLVADFTYVRLGTGVFAYTAFVIDAYAGRILGWECCSSKHARFVEPAIRQAAAVRSRQGYPLSGNAIHHSDAGSQYTSVRFGGSLMLAGMIPSIGRVGDAYDNALAENMIGLCKTEAVRSDSPFRTGPLRSVSDLEHLAGGGSAADPWSELARRHRDHESCSANCILQRRPTPGRACVCIARVSVGDTPTTP